MIVYHVSYTEIDEIDLSKCEPRKDFGRGFYVTRFRKQAETWAKRIGRKHKTKGLVTEFVFYDSAFTDDVFRTLRFEKYDDKWLDFVTLNRRFDAPSPAHDYDIVEGPIADDRISREIDNYIEGNISREKFLSMLSHEEPTHQICFCTADSLLMIKNSDRNKSIDYQISEIGEPLIEQLILDYQIDEIKAADLFYNSKTFQQLSKKSTGLYIKNWQEIYQFLKQELNM